MHASGHCVEITGDVTLDSATAALSVGIKALVEHTNVVFDLGRVGSVDSAALAVVFAWVRAAGVAGKQVRLVNVPDDLQSLANVYGVSEMLPLA